MIFFLSKHLGSKDVYDLPSLFWFYMFKWCKICKSTSPDYTLLEFTYGEILHVQVSLPLCKMGGRRGVHTLPHCHIRLLRELFTWSGAYTKETVGLAWSWGGRGTSGRILCITSLELQIIARKVNTMLLAPELLLLEVGSLWECGYSTRTTVGIQGLRMGGQGPQWVFPQVALVDFSWGSKKRPNRDSKKKSL